MPSFLRSFFSSSPKQVQFVSGEKVIRAKTVKDVLGEAFDYKGSISAQKVFCKKMLQFCATEYQTDNILFLLVCEKYRKTPSSALFAHIHDEFVAQGSPQQVNLSDKNRGDLTTISKLDNPTAPSPSVFEKAELEIWKLFERDTLSRLIKAPFDSAFNMREPGHKRCFDESINYLKTHQITLL
ncbi:MAG: hypothetical protein RBS27_06620 [Giesbergeria sp.]|jgi:hypothetical protein|nr:hypothetical protein [Giesbergeria sp.]